MYRKEIVDVLGKYTDPFRVTKGKDFRLKDFDPGNTLGLKMDKEEAVELLQRGSEWLAMEQDILYAQDSWSLLLVFQAMDAAGSPPSSAPQCSLYDPGGTMPQHRAGVGSCARSSHRRDPFWRPACCEGLRIDCTGGQRRPRKRRPESRGRLCLLL